MNVFIKLMSSGVLVQLLMIFTTLVFTRLFSAESFGELAFYASYGSILAIIGGLRFDYLNLKDSVENKYIGYLVSNLCSFVLNISIFCILVGIKNASHFLNGYNLKYILFFGLSYSFFHNLTQYFISQKDYKKFIISRLVQILSIFVIGISLYNQSYSENALVLAYGFSQFFLGFSGFIVVTKDNYDKVSMNDVKLFFHMNLNEAFKNTVISFMQYSTPLVPILFGGVLFSEKEIGAYFVFSQMISAPLSVIRRNLLIYLNGEFSSPSKFKSVFKYINTKYLKAAMLLAAIGFLIVYLFEARIIELILGNQWTAFSYLLLPLIIYFIIDSLLQPLTTLLPLWGDVDYSIRVEAARFIIIILLLPVVTIYLNLNFFIFLMLFIAIMIIAYVMITLKTLNTAFSISNKEFDYEIK